MLSRDFGDLSTVKIVATIEARTTSTRLPGKVLKEVGGVPLLGLLIDRLKCCETLSEICVATTTNDGDEPIVRLARGRGVSSFVGSESDVLGRVLGAAKSVDADVIVEITGDCPLIDPVLVDSCVLAYFSDPVHYCANNLDRTFPRGLDTQVFSTAVLSEVAELTDEPSDREHVSLYIYEHPERYSLRSVTAIGPLRKPQYRWTVDTQEDLDLVARIIGAVGPHASSLRIVEYLEQNPEVLAINAHIDQKPVR